MKFSKFPLILATTIALMPTSANLAFANTEASAGPLILRKTYIKSEFDNTVVPFFTGETSPAAFSPTTVSCPNPPMSCVLRIDLTTDFNSLTSFDSNLPVVQVAVHILLDGSDQN